MLVRSWLYAVATGLILAGSVQAQDQTNSAEGNAAADSQPAEPNPLGIPVRIIEDRESAQAREGSERESAQREKDDLIAQERMAVATEAMNDATQSMNNAAWVSTVLVFIGTFLLVWTLRVTQEATAQARKTNQIIITEQRPWLTCEIDSFEMRISDEPMETMTDKTIVNHGKRPAFDAILIAKPVRYTSFKEVDDFTGRLISGQMSRDRRPDYPVVFPNSPIADPQNGRSFGGIEGENGRFVGFVTVLMYKTSESEKSRNGLDARAYAMVETKDQIAGHSNLIERFKSRIVR